MKRPEFVSVNNYQEYATELEEYCNWLEEILESTIIQACMTPGEVDGVRYNLDSYAITSNAEAIDWLVENGKARLVWSYGRRRLAYYDDV